MIEINNIVDLQNLITNQVEENLHLDYKAAEALDRADGKRKEIAKDVSAFANSDGGIIIYGIKEFDDLSKRHLPSSIDPINRQIFSKDWLEQIINSNIFPRIDNLEIKPISINESISEVVYVVSIPKSTTAHQASDFIYYKRNNFQNIKMYDFEVRDIMNRNKSPKIELSFKIATHSFETAPFFPSFSFGMNGQLVKQIEVKTTNKLFIIAKNTGAVYVNYLNAFIEIPIAILDDEKYKNGDKYLINGIEYYRIYRDNTIREIKELKLTIGDTNIYDYWPSRYEPILPETSFNFDEINLKEDTQILDGVIYWSVHADNAEKIKGEIQINSVDKSIKDDREG